MAPGPVDLKIVRDRLTHHCDEVTAHELFVVVSRDLGDLKAVAEGLRAAAARLAGGERGQSWDWIGNSLTTSATKRCQPLVSGSCFHRRSAPSTSEIQMTSPSFPSTMR